MRQAIILSMIFFLTFADGFSADYTVKDPKSNSPEKNLVVDNESRKADFQQKQDYTYNDIQGVVNNITDIQDKSGINSELEKTDSPENKESEEARSDMIAGAMGIGIF
jgi:hypothetical protein